MCFLRKMEGGVIFPYSTRKTIMEILFALLALRDIDYDCALLSLGRICRTRYSGVVEYGVSRTPLSVKRSV